MNEQIAYAVEEADVDELLALEQTTHKAIYGDLAVFAASWLRGSNALQANMYAYRDEANRRSDLCGA